MTAQTGVAPAAPSRRHRARSPIIPPGFRPAVLTAVLAGLLAATAPLGQGAAVPAVVLLQLVTAAGWFRLNGMWPARQGIALAFAGGLAADAALLLAPDDRLPEALVGVLGAWFMAVLVLQLRHRGSADERLDSLTATAASSVLAIVAGGHLAAAGLTGDGLSGDAVAATAAGVGAAALLRAVPVPFLSFVLALGAAVGAGAGLTAAGLTDLADRDALAFAAGGGVAALIGLRVASYDFPSRFVHFTAGVALPLTAAAPVAYGLARALL